MKNKIRLFVPSPSSKFYPYISNYLLSCGINYHLDRRKLYFSSQDLVINFVRGFDVPLAISKGWGDIGITGLDAVEEAGLDVEVVKNLGIRFSRVVIASSKLKSINDLKPGQIIVSEYKNIAQSYLSNRGLHMELVFVTGSAESYQNIDNVSAIITLVTSGETLTDNGLQILDTLFDTQACLIINREVNVKKEKLNKIIRLLK